MHATPSPLEDATSHVHPPDKPNDKNMDPLPSLENLTYRLKVTLAYNGAPFSGWQIQPNAPSVQQTLESALELFTHTPMRIHASGRTDAGVHALGQVFHVDLPLSCSLPESQWPDALNTKLPPTIRILKAERVPDDFHARFSALSKTYRYEVVTYRPYLPFEYLRVHHFTYPYDKELLVSAISSFEGTHDFRSFAAVRGNEPDPVPQDFFVRTIMDARVEFTHRGYVITFNGTGFLYKMVRLMVGTAQAVATGKLSLDAFHTLLHAPDKRKTRFAAPPFGLCLLKVDYPDNTHYSEEMR